MVPHGTIASSAGACSGRATTLANASCRMSVVVPTLVCSSADLDLTLQRSARMGIAWKPVPMGLFAWWASALLCIDSSMPMFSYSAVLIVVLAVQPLSIIVCAYGCAPARPSLSQPQRAAHCTEYKDGPVTPASGHHEDSGTSCRLCARLCSTRPAPASEQREPNGMRLSPPPDAPATFLVLRTTSTTWSPRSTSPPCVPSPNVTLRI